MSDDDAGGTDSGEHTAQQERAHGIHRVPSEFYIQFSFIELDVQLSDYRRSLKTVVVIVQHGYQD